MDNKIEGIVNRDVTTNECPWLENDIQKGVKVFKYFGPTYGCIGTGIAVTFVYHVEPFFELPKDSIDFIKNSCNNEIKDLLVLIRNGLDLYIKIEFDSNKQQEFAIIEDAIENRIELNKDDATRLVNFLINWIKD